MALAMILTTPVVSYSSSLVDVLHWEAEDVRVPMGQNQVDLTFRLNWANTTRVPVNATIVTLTFEEVGAFTLVESSLAPGVPGSIMERQGTIPTTPVLSYIGAGVTTMRGWEGEIVLHMRLQIEGNALRNIGDYITLGVSRPPMPGAPTAIVTGVTVVRCDCESICSICENAGGSPTIPEDGGTNNNTTGGGGNNTPGGGTNNTPGGGGNNNTPSGGTNNTPGGGGNNNTPDGGTNNTLGGGGNNNTPGGGTNNTPGGSGNINTPGGGTNNTPGGGGNINTPGGGANNIAGGGGTNTPPGGATESGLVPRTGDEANMLLWGILFGAGLLGLIGLIINLVMHKRKKANEVRIVFDEDNK